MIKIYQIILEKLSLSLHLLLKEERMNKKYKYIIDDYLCKNSSDELIDDALLVLELMNMLEEDEADKLFKIYFIDGYNNFKEATNRLDGAI